MTCTTCTRPILDAGRGDARRTGRARVRGQGAAIRCSNFSAEQLAEVDRVAARSALLDSLCCRTSTTCSGATTTTMSFRSAASWESRTSVLPACERAPNRKYRRGEPAPEGPRLAGRDRGRALRSRRGVCGVRRGARPLAPRACDRCARVDSGCRVDHRRRDETRAGARERRSRGSIVAPERRRAGVPGQTLIRQALFSSPSHRRLVQPGSPSKGGWMNARPSLVAIAVVALVVVGAGAASGSLVPASRASCRAAASASRSIPRTSRRALRTRGGP